MTARRTEQVATYSISIDAATGAPGRLHLWAENGAQIAEFGFVDARVTIPPPRFSSGKAGVSGFLKLDSLPVLLNMLRPGAPVFVEVDEEPPGFVSIQSGARQIAGESDPQARQ